MKVTAIIGSRAKFWGGRAEQAMDFIEGYLDAWPRDELVISGESPGGGVDIWVKQACQRLGISYVGYPAAEGHTADDFHRRNEQMAQEATTVVAILAGSTPGSRDMLNRAFKHRREIHVYFP